MSDDKFDVIVVGAGLAGCTAAYVLAREGLEVVVIERGNGAGSKNMTGGRLYAHTLERILPGFAEEAPIERRVTREKISFLSDRDAVTMDYQAGDYQAGDYQAGGQAAGRRPATAESYTVLRARFDPWLMGKAEEKGASLIDGIRVSELLTRDGRVVGVKAGDDELEADCVILADGVNSLLGESLGFVKKVTPHHCAVGAKELIELTPQQMRDRFGCEGRDGLAWLFAGMPSDGLMGGGFLYTNETSVSLGVVFGLHNIEAAGKSVPQMLEDFKAHPAVRPLIEGGQLIEYSAHVVPEGGLAMVPKIVGDGVLLTGDAAGFCLNVGYTVRGMDLAIASGEAAAKAVIAAKARGDFSAAGLNQYQTLLNDSVVMKDLTLYRKLPGFLDNPRMFGAYPDMAAGVMADLFTVDGPSKPLLKKAGGHLRKVGLLNLVKDGLKGVTSL
ncbi:MAG: FAD-dependent oxidoreductase [Telmatospirillum sp.]|nr:FAD-dependent oxidoreductase [Telmatospirillum sp.]